MFIPEMAVIDSVSEYVENLISPHPFEENPQTDIVRWKLINKRAGFN